MMIKSRWLTRLLVLAGVLTLIIVVSDIARVWHSARSVRALAIAQTGAPLTASATGAEKVARAVYLSKQDDSEGALLLYQDVESAGGEPALVRIARFNSANRYMRDGMKVLDSESPGRAVPLIELAKQTYRGLLLQTPSDWATRYNLSRALILMPDPPPDEKPSAPAPDAERAITTMRGYSPGMP